MSLIKKLGIYDLCPFEGHPNSSLDLSDIKSTIPLIITDERNAHKEEWYFRQLLTDPDNYSSWRKKLG